jgi:ABC-type Fe3+/spermidine/putrescine transport system ATPase subunit
MTAPSEPLLSIRGIAKHFGSTTVLTGITLDVAESEFLTILGESGSGKTTLLRIIAGFEQPGSGELWMRGQRLDLLPPERRNVNTVFQNYALFPHLSVFENIAYGLRAKKVPKREIAGRVNAVLAQMKMADYVRRRPAQLSGGQQQRVALSRALVNRPSVLLLDEPLSALDANLRRHMQLELKALRREIGITFVFVTHDQEEAMTLSDRIVVLRNGGVEQIDTAREIYNHPRTPYVATFIGQTNLLRAHIENGCARVAALKWPYASDKKEVLFSLRPEHIQLSTGSQGFVSCPGTVLSRIFAGSSELLEVDCGSDLVLKIRTPVPSAVDTQVTVSFQPDRLCPLVE